MFFSIFEQFFAELLQFQCNNSVWEDYTYWWVTTQKMGNIRKTPPWNLKIRSKISPERFAPKIQLQLTNPASYKVSYTLWTRSEHFLTCLSHYSVAMDTFFWVKCTSKWLKIAILSSFLSFWAKYSDFEPFLCAFYSKKVSMATE